MIIILTLVVETVKYMNHDPDVEDGKDGKNREAMKGMNSSMLMAQALIITFTS